MAFKSVSDCSTEYRLLKIKSQNVSFSILTDTAKHLYFSFAWPVFYIPWNLVILFITRFFVIVVLDFGLRI